MNNSHAGQGFREGEPDTGGSVRPLSPLPRGERGEGTLAQTSFFATATFFSFTYCGRPLA